MSRSDFISVSELWSSAGVYPRWIQVHLERLSRIRKVNSLRRARNTLATNTGSITDLGVYSKILETLGIEWELVSPHFEWPAPGTPVLLVANHPMGGIESIVLAAMAMNWRPDTRLMYSSLLLQIEGVGNTLLPISTENNSASKALNRSAMREAIKHLSSGGCLAMFPGGDTHMRGIGRQAHESNWSPHAADLAKKTGAVVIPIRFGLRPAKRLPWLGRIRTRFIPEVQSSGQAKLNKGKIQLAVGSPISNSVLKSFSERQHCADFLRLATRVCGEHYALLPRRLEILKGVLNHKSATVGRQQEAPLAPAVDPLLIESELSALHSGALIKAEGDFFIYYVRAPEIPNTLIELGRLREFTFRCIGEGTGKSLDLDEFDDFYSHLLVWDRVQRRLVGAYRMGRAEAHRQRYVETLFQISGPLLRRLHSALELGRSFITPDYQVHSGLLNLMWKGIAQLVAQDPSRPILFGPVSMSAQFHPVSQALILHYLRQNYFDGRNSRSVRAPVPPKLPKKLMGVDLEGLAKGIRSIDHLSFVVSVLEKDGKGIPPLMKHYVRLGGRFLAFGVDKHFGNAVDGLLLLDLRETPFALLKRFMGESTARRFIDHQG